MEGEGKALLLGNGNVDDFGLRCRRFLVYVGGCLLVRF